MRAMLILLVCSVSWACGPGKLPQPEPGTPARTPAAADPGEGGPPAAAPEAARSEPEVDPDEYRELARFCSNPYYLDRKPSRPTRAADLTAELVRVGEKLTRSTDPKIRELAREEFATLVLQLGLWNIRADTPKQGEGADLLAKTFARNLGKNPEDGEWGEFLGTTARWAATFEAQDRLQKNVAERRSKVWERLAKLSPVSGGPAAGRPQAKVSVLRETSPGGFFGSTFSCGLWAENVSGRDLRDCSLVTRSSVVDRTFGNDFRILSFHYIGVWKAGQKVQLDVGPFYDTPALDLVFRTEHSLWCRESSEERVVASQDDAIARLAKDPFERATGNATGGNYQGMERELAPLDRMAPLPEAVREKLAGMRASVREPAAKQFAEIEALEARIPPGRKMRLKNGSLPDSPDIAIELSEPEKKGGPTAVSMVIPVQKGVPKPIEFKGTAKVEVRFHEAKTGRSLRPHIVLEFPRSTLAFVAEGDRLLGTDGITSKWELKGAEGK